MALIDDVKLRYSTARLVQLSTPDQTAPASIDDTFLGTLCDDAEGLFRGETGIDYDTATSAAALAADAGAVKLAKRAAVTTVLAVLYDARGLPGSTQNRDQWAAAESQLKLYARTKGYLRLAAPSTNANWIPSPTPTTAPPFDPARLASMIPSPAHPAGTANANPEFD